MPAAFYPVLWTIDLAWLAFAVVWVALAFNNKRSIYREPLHQRLQYAAAGAVSFFVLRHASPLRAALPISSTTEILGAVLCVLGMAFAIAARLTIGRNWSGIVTLKQEHALITTGPYRFVRHPIYTGLLTAILGTLLALIPTAAAACVFVMMAALFTLKLRREEKLMRQTFPAQYPPYQQRVKALIPFLL